MRYPFSIALPVAALAAVLGGCMSLPSAVPSQEPELASVPLGATGGQAAAVPQRTPASVMKIWIAPWEDAQGDLHDASSVYVEVQSQRWRLADNVASQPVLRPLQVQPREDGHQGVSPGSEAKSVPSAQPDHFAIAAGHTSGV
jgi:hypothetical protein